MGLIRALLGVLKAAVIVFFSPASCPFFGPCSVPVAPCFFAPGHPMRPNEFVRTFLICAWERPLPFRFPDFAFNVRRARAFALSGVGAQECER